MSATEERRELLQGGHAFKGETQMSRMVDAFVAVHCATAFFFASAMLFRPSVFGLFVRGGEAAVSEVMQDSIRWASPFVFGFSMLAGASLSFAAQDRKRVAQIFATSFTIATAVGLSVQATGRWNDYHPINIALFASLAAVYTFFLAHERGAAFYRS